MSKPFENWARPHILVVEDEVLLGMLMEDLLEALGCVCVGPRSNLTEAVESARTDTFDAAILDVLLGRETVYPVARLLVERGIPFAFATGVGREGLETKWAGQACIRKPYVLDDLRSALNALLPH